MSFAVQLLCHWIGDYALQSHSMAVRKVESWYWALMHALFYTFPFAVVLAVIEHENPWVVAALAIIFGTHAVIDRYRLAKWLSWAKNVGLPRHDDDYYTWAEGRKNAGYPDSVPAWMSNWLMIILDNGLHVIINAIAIGALL